MKYLHLCIAVLMLSASTITSYGQSGSYSLEKGASKMSILGTSTLHDWESNVESFSSSATLNEKDLLDISFSAEVKSIKSGKSGMDKNTYNALKANDYPSIDFKSDKLSINGASVKGKGKLTIGGVTKVVDLDLKYEQWTENSFQVMGEIPLKMTDYQIDPPTAMFGTIKTGDEIVVKFEISMNQ